MADRRLALFTVGLLILAAALALVTGAIALPGSGAAARTGTPASRARLASAERSGSSPRCTPATLNASAAIAGTPLSVSPLPGTMLAEPSTQISLLGVPAGDISEVRVKGSRSGLHTGRLIGYSQGDGASFLPSRPFRTGEHVSVRGALDLAGARRTFAFSFTVADQDPLPDRTSKFGPGAGPSGLQHFHSLPNLQAPAVHVSTPAASGIAPGDIFAAAYATGNGPGGPMIFENSGQLVWFKTLPTKESAADFRVQQYEGHPVLTWWQGYTLPQGFGEGEDLIYNSAYQQIASVHAGNGLLADLHEFALNPNGSAITTAFDPVHCNLSAIGGPADAAVTDGVFQEIDVRTGLVRREWHAIDHVRLADSYPKVEVGHARTLFPYDFFHINSVESAPDGITMVSSRNTWTIYNIDSHTGQVLARIGGKQSTVKMGPGTSTAWQHDARTLSNGEITVFDNGAEPKIRPFSRGIVERLDPNTDTMTLLTQYAHSTPLSAGTQGNVQILANGDALLGWGAQPYVSEFSPSGRQIFDARLAIGGQSYRAFRFQWSAQPASRPAAALANGKVYVSWNGATGVASWRLLTGAGPKGMAPSSTVARSGFETAIALTGSAQWFRVQALAADGAVLASTAPARTG